MRPLFLTLKVFPIATVFNSLLALYHLIHSRQFRASPLDDKAENFVAEELPAIKLRV